MSFPNCAPIPGFHTHEDSIGFLSHFNSSNLGPSAMLISSVPPTQLQDSIISTSEEHVHSLDVSPGLSTTDPLPCRIIAYVCFSPMLSRKTFKFRKDQQHRSNHMQQIYGNPLPWIIKVYFVVAGRSSSKYTSRSIENSTISFNASNPQEFEGR